MESFEFLGGRYNRPEQIMSGPMQAFRAQNAATGKTVFIHRVSTTEAPAEQATLLKLLTTALVKSSDAKRLVLDFGEERGYWYVVTESEPQCALLREWLQLEIDSALANSGVAPSQEMKTPDRPPTKMPPSSPKPVAAESGEFTRFLQTRTPHSPPRTTPSLAQEPTPPAPIPAAQMAPTMVAPPRSPAPPPPDAKPEPEMGEFTRVFQKSSNISPSAPPSSPPLPKQAASGPGEFTSFFSGGQKSQEAAPPPQPPQRPSTTVAQPAEQPQGAGEFTRFFTGGLPPSPPKPSAPPPQNFTERPANQPFVQRPNTPVPQAPPVIPLANSAAKPPENGEFTKLFARPANAPPVQRPRVPSYEPPSGADGSDNIFNQNIDIPKPLPSSKPPVGEFTQMFGGGGSATPPVAPPAVVAQQQHKSLLEDVGQFGQAPPQVPRPPQGGPGDFTRMMQSSPRPPAESATAPPVAAPLAAPKLSMPPLKLPAPAAVAVDAGKKKLAIFLGVLAALAVLLVLLMTFLMKK